MVDPPTICASRDYVVPFIEPPWTTLNSVLTLFVLCSADFYLSPRSRGNFERKRESPWVLNSVLVNSDDIDEGSICLVK